MKKLNKLTLAALTIFGVFFYSCQKQDDFSSEITESIKEVETSNLIDYKGLLVNHRFETPIEDLEIRHTQDFLKHKYKSLKDSAAKRKGVTPVIYKVKLPNYKMIAEATKIVIHEFPYKLIDNNINEEIDASTKLEKVKQNWKMIKTDFPTLTEEKIENNIALIEEYYEKNLDYLVLKQIAENENSLAAKIANKTSNSITAEYSKSLCLANVFNLLLLNGKLDYFNIPKAAFALTSVRSQPQIYAEEYYGETNGGNNTRGDAYRHVIWNALLANSYFTINTKGPRIAFAKAVTETYESCTGGDADSKEMDYHNNAIGRKIWSNNTSYVKLLWKNIGLNSPSTNEIKDLVRDAVNEKSCFIVKFKDENYFPNNQLLKDQTITEIKTKIDQTNANTIVYFNGTIAPSIYKYRSNKNNNDVYTVENKSVKSYKKERIEIIACYQL